MMIRSDSPRTAFGVRWLLAVGLVLAAGCGGEKIDGTYGRRRGSPGGESVNGTAVLGEMFREAGSTVASRRFLSPKIHDYDVIVWAPDDFQPPDDEVREFLEAWLARGSKRTLVYIGRDYDAETAYWEAILDAAPAEQRVEVLRRLARARAAYAARRASIPDGQATDWFSMHRDGRSDRTGSQRWSGTWAQDDSLQVSALQAEIQGRLEPPELASSGNRSPYRSEVLLQGPDGILAFRLTHRRQPNSQILVMTNGSFLLNLPLIEKEHRKLAGKLIADCGMPAKVVFLESGPGGPFVFPQEPGSQHPTGLEAFTVWPLGAILWHFLALGVFYLFARLTIFGRPHQLPPEAVSDFGRHVHALGELLAATGDSGYARRQLAQFHERSKQEPRADERPGPDR
jgi:hypothetical protein